MQNTHLTANARRALLKVALGASLACHLLCPKVQAQLPAARIMPLGDSLTSSIDGEASYRYWLWKRLTSAGYRVDFVGSEWGVGSGVSSPYDFDQDHEGHPGVTSTDLLPYIRGFAQRAQPDVVLLLIGGNDLEQGSPASEVLLNTVRIINRLRAANPRVIVLWALLPPEDGLNSRIRQYNSGALKLAYTMSRRESPIRIVNLYNNFSPANDTVDGQHPNPVGERKFANRFYSVLAPLLFRFRG